MDGAQVTYELVDEQGLELGEVSIELGQGDAAAQAIIESFRPLPDCDLPDDWGAITLERIDASVPGADDSVVLGLRIEESGLVMAGMIGIARFGDLSVGVMWGALETLESARPTVEELVALLTDMASRH